MNIWNWFKDGIMGMKDELGFEIIKTGVKEIFTMIVGKAKKEVASAIGATTDEAKKSFDDEGLYLEEILTEALGEEDAGKALRFEEDLRREDPRLAEAYVLAWAKLRRRFKEDYSGPRDASVVKLTQLLIQLNTFEERVAFIKGRGIEALISPPKKDLLKMLEDANLGETYGNIKKDAKKSVRKLQRRLEEDPYKGFLAEALGFIPRAVWVPILALWIVVLFRIF